MAQSSLKPLTFCFGAFTLSRGAGELRKNGVPIRLAPQPFQLLVLLVERAGNLVTRDEMQQAIWSGNTVVDFELGLNRCIRRVREVLADDAEAPRYIETVPRTGYRFIAPVKVLTDEAAPSEAPPMELHAATIPAPTSQGSPRLDHFENKQIYPPHPSKIFKLRWGISIATVVALGIAIGAWFQFRHRSGVGSDFNIVPLASYLGTEYTPSFSPDGRQIAFAWNGEKQDNFDIYVKVIDSQKALRLTNHPDLDYSPAWSPEGGSIAFFRGTHTKAEAIWTISPLGGPERKIVNLRSGVLLEHRGMSWSPDGKWLAYVDAPSTQVEGALFLWNVQSGESRQMTFPGPNEIDMYPAFAPNGRTLAFVRDTGRGISGISLLPVRTDSPARTTPTPLAWKGFEHVSCTHPAWTPDSREIVFASNYGGERRLWIAPATRFAQPRMLASLGLNVTDADISARGQLAFTHEMSNINIWKVNLASIKRGMPSAPVRVIASTRLELTPRVSPDGRKIAFSSNRSGFMEVWISNLDGSDAMPLTAMRNPVTGSPSWSADGQRIAFDSRAARKPIIYVISAQGGKPVALTDDASQNVLPSWSPDDQWIYFTSDRSGRVEIWRMLSSGGAAQQVTFKGGVAALLSPDGKYVYYARDRNSVSSLYRLSLGTGEEKFIASVLWRSFFPMEDGVYYFSGVPDEGPSLRFWDAQAGVSRVILHLDRPIEAGIGLSPDGQDLFYAQVDQGSSDLMLVNHFWQ